MEIKHISSLFILFLCSCSSITEVDFTIVNTPVITTYTTPTRFRFNSIQIPSPIPSQIPTPISSIIGEGSFVVIPIRGISQVTPDPSTSQILFDFDKGVAGDISTGDLYYVIICGSTCVDHFGPNIPAMASIFGKKMPSFINCMERIQTFTKDEIEVLNVGEYICVYTDLGNLSRVKIDEIDKTDNDNIVIVKFSFLTWIR